MSLTVSTCTCPDDGPLCEPCQAQRSRIARVYARLRLRRRERDAGVGSISDSARVWWLQREDRRVGDAA